MLFCIRCNPHGTFFIEVPADSDIVVVVVDTVADNFVVVGIVGAETDFGVVGAGVAVVDRGGVGRLVVAAAIAVAAVVVFAVAVVVAAASIVGAAGEIRSAVLESCWRIQGLRFQYRHCWAQTGLKQQKQQ